MIPATDGAARVVTEQLAGRVNCHRAQSDAVSRFWQYMQKKEGRFGGGGAFAKSALSAATWLQRHSSPPSLSTRCLIPVVRLNIRGRSHCTWLRCPIHPALTESRTAAPHVCGDAVRDAVRSSTAKTSGTVLKKNDKERLRTFIFNWTSLNKYKKKIDCDNPPLYCSKTFFPLHYQHLTRKNSPCLTRGRTCWRCSPS